MKIGDRVKDDLTGKIVTIERINVDTKGNVGLWVSSEYLDGGRHPWEVTTIDEMSEELRNLYREDLYPEVGDYES